MSFESLTITRVPPPEAAALAARAVHEVAIAVGRSTIAVRFSRASAAAAFAERFGDMLGASGPDCVVYAVDGQGEALFWRSPDRVRRWPGVLSDDLLVFFADNVALHEYVTTSADVGLHAAVIARASHLVALVGASTAGKTTTALAATRRGFALYSDERCIIQDGRVVPFLRAITVREGGRTALLDSAATRGAIDTALRALPDRGERVLRPRLLLGDLAGGPPRRLGGVFLITGRDARPSVQACSLYAGLPALLRSMISRDAGIERATRILAEFRTVPVYWLRLGTPDATVDTIERTLDEALAGAVG